MNRRNFAQSVGGVAALSALAEAQQGTPHSEAPQRKTNFYTLDYYYLRQGSQGTRLNDFLSSQLPLFTKNTRVFGVFTSVIGGYLPLTIALAGYGTAEELIASRDRVRGNAEYQAAIEKMEQGAEPPYERIERVLLKATPFASDIVPLAQKPKTPRIFELRVYHSPTERQLRFLHDRFAGPEIKIFHRSGIHPVLYANTIAGPMMPNLTYLTPFADLDAREKAWDAFGADPEWVKVRAESVERGGQIVSNSTITLIRPTPFSPIQ